METSKKSLLLAMLLLATPAHAQEASPASPAPPAAAPTAIQGEYELDLGGLKVDANEGAEFDYKLATGETVKGKLTKRKQRTFAGEGVAFTFSGDFSIRVEKDKEGELTTITMDHAKSPLAMVQIFPGEVKPEAVPKELLEGIKKEFKEKNAKAVREPAPAKRDFKRGPVDGFSMQYSVAGQTIEVEVYAWAAKGKTVAVTLQWASEEADLAREAFTPLVTTLE